MIFKWREKYPTANPFHGHPCHLPSDKVIILVLIIYCCRIIYRTVICIAIDVRYFHIVWFKPILD